MPKKKQKMVRVVVDIVLRGTAYVEMPEKDAENLIDAMDEIRGDADVGELPFDINWDDVLNTGDARVDDIYIKA